jgi:hypothetical protein
MTKVDPYHTINPESQNPGHRDVYHDHDDCPQGRRILPQDRRPGTGNRPRCDDCIRLG